MDETQQELQQRSLRNVRALLDKEEAEMARQKRAPRMLLYAFAPAIVLVLALVLWGGPRMAKPPDPKLLECTMRAWAEMSGAREREIREQNPGIAPAEIGRRLQGESASIEAAATKQCQQARQ